MADNFSYNSIDEIKKMYPYGQFPHQYTRKQKEMDINNHNTYNYYTNDKFEKVSTMSVDKSNEPEPNNHGKGLDIKTLLPLISSFTDHKKLSSGDMLNTILPLMLGNKSKDISAILKLFNKKNDDSTNHQQTKKIDLPPSPYKEIDTYDKA